MKAQRCASPLQAVVGVLEGKNNNNNNNKVTTLAEATQAVMYFDRLQQLVPFCPKDRPMSRLELIQSVIDYICDLQEQLASPSQPGGDDGSDPETGSESETTTATTTDHDENESNQENESDEESVFEEESTTTTTTTITTNNITQPAT